MTGLAQLVFGHSQCQLHQVVALWRHEILNNLPLSLSALFVPGVPGCEIYWPRQIWRENCSVNSRLRDLLSFTRNHLCLHLSEEGLILRRLYVALVLERNVYWSIGSANLGRLSHQYGFSLCFRFGKQIPIWRAHSTIWNESSFSLSLPASAIGDSMLMAYHNWTGVFLQLVCWWCFLRFWITMLVSHPSF